MAKAPRIPTPETVNDILLDRSIRHGVYIERFKTQQASDTVRFFNDRVVPDLVGQLNHRLSKIKTRGFDTSAATTQRFRDLIRVTNGIISGGIKKTSKYTQRKLNHLALSEAEWQQRVFQETIPLDIDFLLPSGPLIDSLTTSRPFQGKLLSEWFRDLGQSTQRNLKQQLNIGLTAGESTQQLVRRINGTNGLLTQTRRHLTTVVRTAVNHVSNQANELTYEANTDVIKGVQFVATLDTRTSEICMSLDGQVFKVGEGDRPPMHHQCRSRTAPVTKSWKEMGFTDKQLRDIPSQVRQAMDGKVAGTLTYPQWLRKQPKEIQIQALGRKRANLFRQNKLNLSPKSLSVTKRPLTIEQLRKREFVSPLILKPTIPELLEQLKLPGLEAKEKKAIRAKLRKLGHKGGVKTVKTVKTSKPKPKPQSKPIGVKPTPKQVEIDELLVRLNGTAITPKEKSKIRARLRKLGHSGGAKKIVTPTKNSSKGTNGPPAFPKKLISDISKNNDNDAGAKDIKAPSTATGVKAKKAIIKEGKYLSSEFPVLDKFLSGAPVKQIELFDGKIKGASVGIAGQYSWSSKRIQLRVTGSEISKRGTLSFGKSSIENSLTGTYRHELGHAYHDSLTLSQQNKFIKVWDSIPKRRWQKDVSQYAGTNMQELFAEAFSAYTHPKYGVGGKRLPKSLHSFFEKDLKLVRGSAKVIKSKKQFSAGTSDVNQQIFSDFLDTRLGKFAPRNRMYKELKKLGPVPDSLRREIEFKTMKAFRALENHLAKVNPESSTGIVNKPLPNPTKKFKTTKDWVKNLDINQREALIAWKSETSVTRAIRDVYEKKPKKQFDKVFKDWGKDPKVALNHLQTAMDSAPDFQGTVYRGMSIPTKDADKFLKVDKTFELKSMASASTKVNIADNFAGFAGQDFGGERVVLKINTKNGVDIRHFNNPEGEVILRPGKYKVTRVRKKAVTFDRGNRAPATELTLEPV
jgi:SPP1 gp7 family putative phage head morphogenesis protein